MKKEDWVWMPHAGHLIVSRSCQFHLNTWVGNYIVSTVGEYFPDSAVRRITAKFRNIEIQGRGDSYDADYMKKIGFEDIGWNRKYETMVFKAKKSKNKCCPYEMETSDSLDVEGYNDPELATLGHVKLCKKWAKRK